MPKYLVTATATIYLDRTIDAENKEEAVETCRVDWDFDFDLVGGLDELTVEDINEEEVP